MKLSKILKLLFTGKPIIQTYQIDISETDFKEKLSKIIGNSYPHSKKEVHYFNGYIFGDYGNNFEIKIHPRFFNNKSNNNLIKITGNIKAIESNKIVIKLVFNRTQFFKYALVIVSLIFVIIGWILINRLSNTNDLLISLVVILFFFLVFLAISTNKIIQGIKYTLNILSL